MRRILTSLFVIYSSLSFGQVYINELLASNQNDLLDEALQTDDWIELYNASASQVDLSGYYLTDDPLDLIKWQIPSGTIISGGGFLLFWADNDLLDGPLHTNFRLTSEGETLSLVEPDGTTIVDQVTFGLQQSDISYGRASDGAPDWVFFNNTTPLATNMEVQPPTAILFINEVMAFNTNNVTDNLEEHEGWIEIYNPNGTQVNLAGYYLGTPGDPTIFQFASTNPVLTTIPANSFRIFWMDGQTEQGENHVSFELGLAEGTIRLTAPDGTSNVSSYNYPAAVLNQSWGRISDGGLSSQWFTIPTPRVTNALVIIQPEELYINEVMGANQTGITDEFGELEDWIEIYNPNAFDVDLAGYFFSDNPENPMKWQVPDGFPAETTVEAGGWILFWADEDGIQGPRHISFRVNNQGEDIRLYSPDGFTLAHRVLTPYIAPDLSYGLFTDGNEPWVTFVQTTPDASNNGATVDVSEEIIEKYEFLYPNPAVNGVVLNEKGVTRIFGNDGKMLSEVSHQDSWLDLSSFRNGLYFVQSASGKVYRVLILR